MNCEDKLYAIQRRVLSAELAIFSTAHMRLSDSQISVFKMLMTVYQLGYDLGIDEYAMDDFIRDAAVVGITIS